MPRTEAAMPAVVAVEAAVAQLPASRLGLRPGGPGHEARKPQIPNKFQIHAILAAHFTLLAAGCSACPATNMPRTEAAMCWPLSL